MYVIFFPPVHGSEHEVERKMRNADLEEQMIDDFVVARPD